MTYGTSPPYGLPSVRSFSSPGQQTRRSSRRTIGYTRILSQVRGERRAVPHADERVLGQPDRGPVRALAHLCHEQLGLPESPPRWPASCRPTCAGATPKARYPDMLAAQRRERARIRSERQQRWGRPKPKAV